MKLLVQMFAYTRLYETTLYKCLHTLGFMKLLVQMFAYTRLYETTCTNVCIHWAL